jgi:3',5'-cyclic AMP phosphodiesterase CpdA
MLRALPQPQIVVPGNHDIPSYDLFARFRRSLDLYREYISKDLEPFFLDDEIAIIGLNTARSLVIKNGRINHDQIAAVESRMCGLDERIVKVVVTHHPFDLPEDFRNRALVGRARKAMARFAHCGVDMLLAGHWHRTSCGPTAERYGDGHQSAIFVQAGTACSTRQRGEPNSFNLIRTTTETIEVQAWSSHAGDKFHPQPSQHFRRGHSGWGKHRHEHG